MNPDTPVEYRPPWAPHVRGWHYERTVDEETGIPEDVEVGAVCEHPGCAIQPGDFKRRCASGLYREWIGRFARLHLHRDALNDKPPERTP